MIMERRIKAIITSLALISTLSAVLADRVAAQDYVAPPVTISKEKVKIDGKVFLSHIVLEKQTLFSISKAYNVTVDDIYRYNPTLKETGLKKNSIILIPTAETISPAEPEESHKKVEGNVHMVRWFEDLATIAEKYGVSEHSIMAANGLKDKKLKNRQKLIIPPPAPTVCVCPEESEPLTENVIIEEEDMNLDTAFEDKDTIQTIFPSLNKVNATLLIPLKATGASSSRGNMDFYSGALLAAKDMTEEGIDVSLEVYDIANGSFGTTKARLEASDIIIGPVAADDIRKLYSLAPGIGPVISPLDPRSETIAYEHETFVHAPSSQMAQYHDIAAWIKEDLMSDDKVVVISEKEVRTNDGGRKMLAALDSAGLAYTPFSYSILDGREIQIPIEEKMTDVGVNRVVIASDSEAFVNDVVRNLNLIIHDKFNVVLYAPAKIRTFETIEVENFHNTSLHASLTYYIDYEDQRVKNFLMKYRALFGTEPTQFAFQGYDVARYFFGLYSKYGEYWNLMIEKSDSNMLQSCFAYRPVPGGGFTNTGIKRIIYGKDYSIIPVK